MAHTPTSAQRTQLATLLAAQVAANAALVTAQSTLATATATKIAADKAVALYNNNMYGVRKGANIIDDDPDKA